MEEEEEDKKKGVEDYSSKVAEGVNMLISGGTKMNCGMQGKNTISKTPCRCKMRAFRNTDIDTHRPAHMHKDACPYARLCPLMFVIYSCLKRILGLNMSNKAKASGVD